MQSAINWRSFETVEAGTEPTFFNSQNYFIFVIEISNNRELQQKNELSDTRTMSDHYVNSLLYNFVDQMKL